MKPPLPTSLIVSGLVLLAIFNIASLFIAQAPPAQAKFDQTEFAEMTWRQLRKHKDFRRAVRDIIEECRIGEEGKVVCD